DFHYQPTINVILTIYKSALKHINEFSQRNFQQEIQSLKLCRLFLQMLHKLVQCNCVITSIESYKDFINCLLQLHSVLDQTYLDQKFLIDYYNQTNVIQDILINFMSYALETTTTFFHDLWAVLSTTITTYSKLIVLLRCIEAYNYSVDKINENQQCSSYITKIFLKCLYQFVDECYVQFMLPVMTPQTFHKPNETYSTIYDCVSMHLLRLFQHYPIQTVVTSIGHLYSNSTIRQINVDQRQYQKNVSVISTSVLLSFDLIVQSCYSCSKSTSCHILVGLLLVQIIKSPLFVLSYSRQSLINYFTENKEFLRLKMQTIDLFNIDKHDYSIIFKLLNLKQSTKSLDMLKTVYPSTTNQLHLFVQLVKCVQLTEQQIHYISSSILSNIQQFFSLPTINNEAINNLLLLLQILRLLTKQQQQVLRTEDVRRLFHHLSIVLTTLDLPNILTINIHVMLLKTISSYSLLMEDDDLSRILDYCLTVDLILNNHYSMTYHFESLNLISKLCFRQQRSKSLTELIIQLLVRYGSQLLSQTYTILHLQLILVYYQYLKFSSNDDTIIKKVNSQCQLLRVRMNETITVMNDKKCEQNRDEFYLNKLLLRANDVQLFVIYQQKLDREYEIQSSKTMYHYYKLMIQTIEKQSINLSDDPEMQIQE
ncbi:unnamed protein product, partial [Didymodactylos carnosus]